MRELRRRYALSPLTNILVAVLCMKPDISVPKRSASSASGVIRPGEQSIMLPTGNMDPLRACMRLKNEFSVPRPPLEKLCTMTRGHEPSVSWGSASISLSAHCSCSPCRYRKFHRSTVCITIVEPGHSSVYGSAYLDTWRISPSIQPSTSTIGALATWSVGRWISRVLWICSKLTPLYVEYADMALGIRATAIGRT